MAKITGGGTRFTQRLKNLSPRALELVSQALKVAGDRVVDEAQHSITVGSVSGKSHKASIAPAAPHNDTSVLKNNIESVQVEPLLVEVSSNAPYAAIHEYGGTINHPGGTPFFIGKDGKPRFVSKGGIGASHNLPVTKPHKITLPERPYMRPALLKTKPEIVALVKRAVKSAVDEAKG